MITKKNTPEGTEKEQEEKKLLTIEISKDDELIMAFQKCVDKLKKRFGVSWLLPAFFALQMMSVQMYKRKLIDDATYDAICDELQPAIEGATHLQI